MLKSAKVINHPVPVSKMSYNKSAVTTKYGKSSQQKNRPGSPKSVTQINFGESEALDEELHSKEFIDKLIPEKKKDYQLNHMFKIINFLEEDEGLNIQREKFREKMRQLKKATYKDGTEDEDDDKLEGFEVKMTIGVGSYAVVKLCTE